MIDEIHLLGADRGPILEVIVSRMRYIAAQVRCAEWWWRWVVGLAAYAVNMLRHALPCPCQPACLPPVLGRQPCTHPWHLALLPNLQTERAIRFVGLSTALANAQDLADWLGITGPVRHTLQSTCPPCLPYPAMCPAPCCLRAGSPSALHGCCFCPSPARLPPAGPVQLQAQRAPCAARVPHPGGWGCHLSSWTLLCPAVLHCTALC